MLVLKKNNIFKRVLIVTILSLSFTSLNAFNLGGISFSFFLLCSTIFIGLISVFEFKMPALKDELVILISFYIILSALLNLSTFKATSVIYSFLFLFLFLYITHYSKKHLSVDNFIWILKFILIAFFIILLISQIAVLFDLHNLEGPKGYFQSTGQLGIQYNNITGVYRFHSLSTEPSYAAIIVLISFAVLSGLVDEKKKLVVYGVILLYMLFSFKSAIGFIILVFWIFAQFKIKRKYFIISGSIVLIGILLFFFTNVGGKSVERIREVVFLLFSDSSNFIKNLNLIDSSAYARIGPTFTYIKEMDLLNYHTYFGFGAASSEPYFSKIIYPEAWNKHMVFRPPFIPGFLYDYGFIGAFLVFAFIWKHIKKQNIFFKVVFLLIIINSNFNTQLFWFAIIFIYLYNFYKPKTKGLINQE